MGMMLGNTPENTEETTTIPDTGPIDQNGQKMIKLTLVRWIVLGFIVIYMLLAYFHAPILTGLGKFLVVSHSPEKSDLTVCLTGSNIERGLAAADAYNNEFAPIILIPREMPPDGSRILKERGLNYPEKEDLLTMLLKGLGVPRDALLISNQAVANLFEEAEMVKKVMDDKGYRSIIVITSPVHSRRAWLTFRKVFRGDENIRILVIPTSYSKFKPEDWWKKGPYFNEVIGEYGKLIVNSLKFF